MNVRAVVLGSWFLLGLASFVLVPACGGSDETLADDDNGDDDESSSGASGSSSSSGRIGSSSSSSGSSGKKDAGKDATTSEEQDAEPDAEAPIDLKPGDACPTAGQKFTRDCGECGTQDAYCTPALVVGGYGACKEPLGGCPAIDAGIAFDSGAPVDSGVAPIDAGSVTPLPTLTLGNAVNQSTSLLIADEQGRAAKIGGDSAGTRACPTPLEPAAQVLYAYMKLVNPNGVAATVELTGVNGLPGDNADQWMAVYSTLPQSDADRRACSGYYDNACGKYLGTACLKGNYAIVVPANGAVYVYLGRHVDVQAWNDPTMTAKIIALP